MKYTLEQTKMEDIEIAMDIINDGKEYLKQQGID